MVTERWLAMPIVQRSTREIGIVNFMELPRRVTSDTHVDADRPS